MPRKVGLGPPIFKIERLSDGVDVMQVDDFTGQPIPQPNAKPLPGAQELRDGANRVTRIRLQRIANDLFGPKPTQTPFKRRL